MPLLSSVLLEIGISQPLQRFVNVRNSGDVAVGCGETFACGSGNDS